MIRLLRKAWHAVTGLGIPVDALLSVIVVIAWLVFMAISTGDTPSTLYGGLYSLPPLALIWFRDAMSEIVGSVGLHQIDAESPPGLIAFFGWVGLLAMIGMTVSGTHQ